MKSIIHSKVSIYKKNNGLGRGNTTLLDIVAFFACVICDFVYIMSCIITHVKIAESI